MAFKIPKENKAVLETAKKFENLSTEIIKEEIIKVPLSKLKMHPDNEKIYENLKDKTRIKELAEDIKENSLLTPLHVIKENDNYIIIAGNTRFLSCEMINYDPVDVIVRDYSNFQARRLLISSNNNREKSVIQRANEIEYLRNLYTEYKKEIPESVKNITEIIAEDLKTTISTVQRADRLNKVDPEIKKAIQNENISPSSAQRLADIDKDTQKEIARTLKEENKKINNEDTKQIVDIEKKYKKEIEEKEKEIESLKKQIQEDSIFSDSKMPENKLEENEEILYLKREIESLKNAKNEKIKEIIKTEKTNINYIVSSIEDNKIKILKDFSFLKTEIDNEEEKEKAKKLIDDFIKELQNIKL